MNQNIPAAPEQLAQAWTEFKQWYANCITSAPKPDPDKAGVTFLHIYRWCDNWAIDTAPLDAICAKYNISSQALKDLVKKHKRPAMFACMVKVLAAVDMERLHAPVLNVAMGLEAGTYTVVYDYPLTNETRKQHDFTEKTTLAEFLHACALDYKAIYAEEEASLTIPAVFEQPLRNGMVLGNRNRTDGVHGIWGHVMSDLWFEGVSVDTLTKNIKLFIGS